MEQQYIYDDYDFLDLVIRKYNVNKIFLVCGKSYDSLSFATNFSSILKKYGVCVERFSDFAPNPQYESVCKGVEAFNASGAQLIMTVGGGSAIDVAKCIKLYYNMDKGVNYLKQEIVANDIPFIAVPTTAGTGSEATRYAVIYYEGKKQSITHDSAIPEVVFFAPDSLTSLPVYHKKAALLDALSHAVEAFWSVNATEKSREYSRKAIELICDNLGNYLGNKDESNIKMMEAANWAGKAINITQTTAGHAMCYKLTSLYGYAHGHSAALCNGVLWPYMVEYGNLSSIFDELAACFGKNSAAEGAKVFIDIIRKLDMEIPKITSEQTLNELAESVNPVRLKNNPVKLDADVIKELYRKISCL